MSLQITVKYKVATFFMKTRKTRCDNHKETVSYQLLVTL